MLAKKWNENKILKHSIHVYHEYCIPKIIFILKNKKIKKFHNDTKLFFFRYYSSCKNMIPLGVITSGRSSVCAWRPTWWCRPFWYSGSWPPQGKCSSYSRSIKAADPDPYLDPDPSAEINKNRIQTHPTKPVDVILLIVKEIVIHYIS